LEATSSAGVSTGLYLRAYGPSDTLETVSGPAAFLTPGEEAEIRWCIDDLDGRPIAQVGLEIRSNLPATGTVTLDWLTWEGSPRVEFKRPAGGGALWRRAWVNTMDQWSTDLPEAFNVIANSGRGLLIQGTRAWEDYQVSATLTPHVCEAFGIAVRVQGLRRYYALLLSRPGTARLVKVGPEGEQTLAAADFPWSFWQAVDVCVEVHGNRLRAMAGGHLLLEAEDVQATYAGGALALISQAGSVAAETVRVAPFEP
jgi:hypothetical protein